MGKRKRGREKGGEKKGEKRGRRNGGEETKRGKEREGSRKLSPFVYLVDWLIFQDVVLELTL